MNEIKFYDTNALLHNLKEVKENDISYISSMTLKELENIKVSNGKDEDIKFKARQVTRFLKENEDKYKCIIVQDRHYKLLEELKLDDSPDNLIMACAYLLQRELNEEITMISNDLCLYNICKNIFNLKVENNYNTNIDEYTGYKEVIMNDNDLAEWYQNQQNKWELINNQYLLIKNENEKIIDYYRYIDGGFEPIKFENLNGTKLTDKLRPRNIKQQLAFDMLQNPKNRIKILQGIHGSGKTLLLVNHALELIQQGKFDKIVYVIQNQQVSNTNDIGALPGELEDKLLPWTNILADKVGGQMGIDILISERKLEIIPLAFIRGRSFKNSIVLMSETENTTVSHMKLLLSRLEEGSILMLDGDFKQTDRDIFKANNGLKTTIEKLKGCSELGLMTLNDVERSKLANLASLLD